MKQWLPSEPCGKLACFSAAVFWPDAFEVHHTAHPANLCAAPLCKFPPLPQHTHCEQHLDRERTSSQRAAREMVVAQRTIDARAHSKLAPPAQRPRRRLHERVSWIQDVMDEIKVRYFGTRACQQIIDLCHTENRAVTLDILQHKINGFDVPTITRDLETLEQRAKGKLMAHRQLMLDAEEESRLETIGTPRPATKTASKARTGSLSDVRAARRAGV